MRFITFRFFVITCFILISQLVINAQSSVVSKHDLKKLAKCMTGTFSSQKQSLLDSTFFHISLHMTPIWKKSKDGFWLYVEQAMATGLDKPYRQRIYHLYIQDDSTLVSKVYEIQNAKDVINAWKDKHKLALLSKEKLADRQGCSIYLHKTSDAEYKGATPGKDCLSSLRGATYATSEVVINKTGMTSWDRGWDAMDKQVWGAVKSGYIFLKEQHR